MKQIDVRPVPESTAEVAAFVEETLEEAGCPLKAITSMNIAVDELFSNIARYSGATRATVACGVEDGCAVLRLTDDGAPYDPTRRAQPELGQSADERAIGGLGIHLVKKLMDEVAYEYANACNVLTIRKRVE